jgi:hypothetical protein
MKPSPVKVRAQSAIYMAVNQLGKQAEQGQPRRAGQLRASN